ncbi:MAG: hypothetical protein E6K96_07990 [Thaumarchaeota archaeon]|nr:MAG: hypothetical protein E6K96_07990 [Nitrososphaerota archaeon]
MRVAFEMKVICSGVEVAAKLERVLGPDNRRVPHDQRFLMRRSGKTLLFEMNSPRPLSALASVESLLNDINLFKEVWLLSS